MAREWVTSVVHRFLDGDSAVRDLLTRGVLNYRALARWMIETEKWTVSEEAVVSAIRRYASKATTARIQDARAVLARSQITSRNDICIINLPRNNQTHQVVRELLGLLDPTKDDVVHYIEEDENSLLITTKNGYQIAQQFVDQDEVTHETHGITQYAINVSEEGPQTPGVLSIVLSALSSHNINVIELITIKNTLILYVHDQDALKTYHILSADTPARNPSEH